MSSIVFSTGYVDEQRSESAGGRKKRLYLFLIALVAVLLAVELSFQLFIAPGLAINRIDIHCTEGFQLSDNEILKLAGLDTAKLYYFSVNTAQVKSRLMQHPLVKAADVKKHFPGSVSIFITERIPLAVSLVNTGGRTVPVVFDENGVVFEIGRSVTDYQLPVVSGLKFLDVKLGARLPGELLSYLSELKNLRETNPALFSQISELKFINRKNAGYEVLIYPAKNGVRVRTGSVLNDTLVKQIFVVLDIIEKNGLKSQMDELDFRAGQVVFKVKEG